MSRAQKQVRLEIDGEITEEDLLSIAGERGIKPPAVVKLRATHHMLARLLATGMKPGEAAIAAGLSPSRVSILQSDPAFMDLIAVYQQQKDIIVVDVMQRVAEVTTLAVEEMKERLLEAPTEIGTGQLLDIAEMGLDRLGHSPVQKHEIRHTDASTLKLAADEARRGKVSYRQLGADSQVVLEGTLDENKAEPVAAEGPEI